MKKLIDFIKHHQVIAFFVITFTITWGLGFTFDAVMNQGKYLLAPLTFVALCGPALAGIIVTGITDTQPLSEKGKASWIAFFVALCLVTLVFLANNTFINHAPFSPLLTVFIMVSAIPVAFIFGAAYSRRPVVRNYLRSLVHIRGRNWWLLLALILVPGLNLLSITVSRLFGRPPIITFNLPATGLALTGLIIVKFLYQIFFFNLTGEEVGWRGFLLPRLQARTNPLVACLIMTFFWALWHLFLWQAEGQLVFNLQFWAEKFLTLFPATVAIHFIFNHSKGSILVAGVTHAAANTAFAFMPNLDWPIHTATMYAFALVVVVVDQMWKKLPTDHPAIHQTPLLDAGRRMPIGNSQL